MTYNILHPFALIPGKTLTYNQPLASLPPQRYPPLASVPRASVAGYGHALAGRASPPAHFQLNRMGPMRSITIVVDNREVKPLQFPPNIVILDPSRPPALKSSLSLSIRTRPARLETADYALSPESLEALALGPITVYTPDNASRTCAVVETKRSIDEIATNCFSPHARQNFIAALDRMRASYAFPYLVFDGGLTSLHRPSRNPNARNPLIALDALLRVLMERNIGFIPVDGSSNLQRARTADLVARLLINAEIVGSPIRSEPLTA